MRASIIALTMALALAGAAGAEPAARPVPAAATPALSPAMAEAEANRARMKTRPEVATPVKPDYPDSERALGHGGRVYVRGIVGVDGRMTELTILRSSAGPVLDAAALASVKATVFKPAKDAEGRPLAMVIAMPVEFGSPEISPTWTKWVDAAYPDAERDAGHFGKVVIGGKIGADGRLIDPVVKDSSRAPGLDAAALAAATASEYRVTRDTEGKVLEMPVAIPYEFDNYRTPGKGGGVLRYKCGQFARDQDWWNATWPDKKDGFYTLMLGLSMIVKSNGMADLKNFKSDMDDFKARWAKAVETCRGKPDALVIDVFKPEGDWARRLAEKGSYGL